MTATHDRPMSLGDHLEELRRCLLRALIGFGVGMVVCLVLGDWIMQLMCWPAAVAMRFSGVPVHLRTFQPAEGFTTYLQTCAIWGLIIAAPYSLVQVWRFIAAGLEDSERRHVRRLVPFSAGLFFAGAAFFFVVVAPLCLSFFFGFGQRNYPMPRWSNPVFDRLSGRPARHEQPSTQPAPATQPAGLATAPPMLTILPVLDAPPESPLEGQVWINARDGRVNVFSEGDVRVLSPTAETFLTPELTLSAYMTFTAWLSLVFGLGFQMPLVVLALVRLGIIGRGRLTRYRRHVVLVLLGVSAIMTPPDVLSQVALTVPMYALFELGLLLARERV